MQALSYYYFEHLVWKRFEREIVSGKFDIVHRLTPLSPAIPSLIANRCARHGVPFVWGPINGGVPWPPGFAAVQRREGEWLHAVRGAHRLLPGYASTRENATAIIVGSIAARNELPTEALGRTVYLPENAIDEERFPEARTGPVVLPLRVGFVGRLVALKGVDMLIEAAAPLINVGQVVIDIIGDGPEKESLRALCERLRCDQGVRFHGWVQHDEVPSHLLEAHVLGFPSVREFGGGVVLEAMALGVVPIVANYGGPAELVTNDTGFRIALASREDLIVSMREVLEKLVANPTPLQEMSRRARERVHSLFTWKAKARQTNEIYRWVLGRRDKPDFGMPLERAT
jgi:glycosyltransferase involved in cell wall biosynthesis